jgi:hypothetical protein
MSFKRSDRDEKDLEKLRVLVAVPYNRFDPFSDI